MYASLKKTQISPRHLELERLVVCHDTTGVRLCTVPFKMTTADPLSGAPEGAVRKRPHIPVKLMLTHTCHESTARELHLYSDCMGTMHSVGQRLRRCVDHTCTQKEGNQRRTKMQCVYRGFMRAPANQRRVVRRSARPSPSSSAPA